ncbi:DNA-directed RNA polymerase subunit omega [Salipiger sp. PrR002]|uniref:DNA-directed RNA polymerase subunit omega n=1 Tax=Salipiger sp. PrR002 TaxID=2706489 RepID=UPI0013B5D50C|nr:DNA-directed RNA polymerase subunit omega [Salipiger sp. PrR002]NDW01430.1 DNA-directed RNA polymerase subunit omega [Salipiger sp. PrR002]NDW59861.1 DNA-directed RNA polymerase subunit omega [Salipiger sp. PrR004]
MNPFVAIDAQQAVPDRFALVLAASARSRALKAGAEPRVEPQRQAAEEVALEEIATGAISQEELRHFLPAPACRRLARPH